jgi:hypothetical protein
MRTESVAETGRFDLYGSIYLTQFAGTNGDETGSSGIADKAGLYIEPSGSAVHADKLRRWRRYLD